MTPGEFKNYQLGIIALRGFNSQSSAGGFDVEPSIPPQKKKKKMHRLYVWRNVMLDPSEPCRLCICAKQWSCQWLTKCHVISAKSGIRKQYSCKRILTFSYKNSIDVNFIKTRFEFPIDDYDQWFRPNMDSLVLFIRALAFGYSSFETGTHYSL